MTPTLTKTRPIIFTGESVRQILAGKKTQTRRIMRTQPSEDWSPESYGDVHKLVNGEPEEGLVIGWGPTNWDGHEAWPCPHGVLGDRLWVKETWQTHCDKDGLTPKELPVDSAIQYPATHDHWKSKRRSSMFMPRWASRITLEIKSIRVERVQDISEADAQAEGCERPILSPAQVDFGDGKMTAVHPLTGYYRDDFQRRWQKINGRKHPWPSNPWVWILEFAKVEKEQLTV